MTQEGHYRFFPIGNNEDGNDLGLSLVHEEVRTYAREDGVSPPELAASQMREAIADYRKVGHITSEKDAEAAVAAVRAEDWSN